jgi:hypothetical protein
MRFPLALIAAVSAELGSVTLTGGVSDITFKESGEVVGAINYSPLVALGPPAQSYNGVYIAACEWGTPTNSTTLELLWLEHAGDPYGHGTHAGGLLHWDGQGAVFDGWLNVADDAVIGGNIDITGDAVIAGTTTVASLSITSGMVYLGDGVDLGAADSGGTGYRVLRVPN